MVVVVVVVVKIIAVIVAVMVMVMVIERVTTLVFGRYVYCVAMPTVHSVSSGHAPGQP